VNGLFQSYIIAYFFNVLHTLYAICRS